MTLVRQELSALGGKIASAGDALERRLVNIGETLGFGNIPLVFLKQFRDATYADRACYQAIIASLFTVTRLETAYLLGDYEITLFDYPSAPIRRDFGFAAGALKPKLSFYVEFDFVAQPGRELWKAP